MQILFLGQVPQRVFEHGVAEGVAGLREARRRLRPGPAARQMRVAATRSGAFCQWQGGKLRLYKCRLQPAEGGTAAGQVVSMGWGTVGIALNGGT